ncbi:MAG: hypothetical protein R3F34_13510 [Planctomycetota bacterium]
MRNELEPAPEVLITLSESALERVKRVPSATTVLVWPVPDPYAVTGDLDRVMRAYRAARDEIRERIDEWLADGAPPLDLEPVRARRG